MISGSSDAVSQDIYATQFVVEEDEYAFFLRKGEGVVLVSAVNPVINGSLLEVIQNVPYLQDQTALSTSTIGNAIGTVAAGAAAFIKVNLWGKQVVPA